MSRQEERQRIVERMALDMYYEKRLEELQYWAKRSRESDEIFIAKLEMIARSELSAIDQVMIKKGMYSRIGRMIRNG